jgi:Holliday junction resolvasome RuvABC endonuclease subunit
MSEPARDLFDEPLEPAATWRAPLLGECVLGIDPSLTGFAICYSVPGKALIEGRWASKPCDGVRPRLARYEQLIRGTLEIVLAQQPSLILIEAYAYGARGGMQFDRTELGGVLRLELIRRTEVEVPIIEPTPSTLKKFTTGSGLATKDAMVSTLAKKHQRVFRTDDAADAFALCQLGLALTGQVPAPSTKPERLYLAKLRKDFGLERAASGGAR